MDEQILIEKYRPQTLIQIIGQPKIVKPLQRFVKEKNIPHLLFSGNPGTGKTTASIAIAKELYGKEWRQNFMELNASDDRGIDTIRIKVKEYAETKSMGDISFKIILLDEADSLTKDAQSALRRTMEKYTNSCRFILSCNYSSKIIEPIQSRCAVYRFRKISNIDMTNQLKYVASQEKIIIDPEALEAITYVSEGDLRKAINILDTARLSSDPTSTTPSKVTINEIYQVSSYIEPKLISGIIYDALSREFFKAITSIETLITDGLNAEDILKQMMNIIFDMNISDKMKVDIIERIGEVHWRISEGANELICMKWLVAGIVNIGMV